MEDKEKVEKRERESGEGTKKLSYMNEKNFVSTQTIKQIRGGGKAEVCFDLLTLYGS